MRAAPPKRNAPLTASGPPKLHRRVLTRFGAHRRCALHLTEDLRVHSGRRSTCCRALPTYWSATLLRSVDQTHTGGNMDVALRDFKHSNLVMLHAACHRCAFIPFLSGMAGKWMWSLTSETPSSRPRRSRPARHASHPCATQLPPPKACAACRSSRCPSCATVRSALSRAPTRHVYTRFVHLGSRTAHPAQARHDERWLARMFVCTEGAQWLLHDGCCGTMILRARV